ncbi:MAG: galactose mutarotase [Phycisphaerae bacterium]|nr:galactose mutarotase [Phycisphaerae bacterium]
MAVTTDIYGKLESGTEVHVFTLTNANGVKAKIINWGCCLVSLEVPDSKGNFADIILGFDDIKKWAKNPPYFSAVIGRYANRIANGLFVIDDNEYSLAINNGPNSLHGGSVGFDKVLWNAMEIENGVELKHTSPDGDEGYPGKLDITVTYTLTEANELKINYKAITDKPTVVNMTNHSYFNLAGHNSGSMLDQIMQINASNYTPIDENLIPTGEIAAVTGTPLDFTSPAVIGDRIDDDFEQLKLAAGYDHNFVIDRQAPGLVLAATAIDSKSGRIMEVLTTEPGVQFYSANFLDGSDIGKGCFAYQRRYGFCLETQHFPDSPNQPQFPTVRLNPGETYDTTTVYKFSVTQ